MTIAEAVEVRGMPLSRAIRLHARGLGRPFRAEEMALVLLASGYRGNDLEGMVRVEVHRHPARYRRWAMGLYEYQEDA